MAKKRKPQKFLDLKRMEKFLRDYQKMPYKSKSAIMAAVLVVLILPLVLIYPLDQPSKTPIDLAPLEITTESECFITGCANQFCLENKIDSPVNKCDILSEFQCLKQSKCERQPSGRCGWTQTSEYLSCISKLNHK